MTTVIVEVFYFLLSFVNRVVVFGENRKLKAIETLNRWHRKIVGFPLSLENAVVIRLFHIIVSARFFHLRALLPHALLIAQIYTIVALAATSIMSLMGSYCDYACVHESRYLTLELMNFSCDLNFRVRRRCCRNRQVFSPIVAAGGTFDDIHN